MSRYDEPSFFDKYCTMRNISIAILAVIGFIVLLCSFKVVAPDQGQEAVLIDKPYFFGHGGIQKFPVETGRSFTWASTKSVYVTIYPQQMDAEFKDIMTSDGVPLDFHTAIRLQVTDSVGLIRDFGPDWYKQNVEQAFANRVRDAVKKHGMNETAIDTTAVEAIDNEITESLSSYLAETKIPVKLLNVTVGKANPPDAILTQRVQTAQEQQRIMTEKQRKLAEDGRRDAEESRAAADNAYREAMNMSTEQFIELERIKMMNTICGDGKSNCTFFIGQPGVTPVKSVN